MSEISVGIVRIRRVRAFQLDQKWCSIEPEPRHSDFQPIAHDVLDFFANCPIGDIEVRLVVVESMIVVLARYIVESPCGFLMFWKDDALCSIWRQFVSPNVVLPVLGLRVGARRLESGMIDRSVIDDKVDDDANAALAALPREVDETPGVPEPPVDVIVIEDIVTFVPVRAGVEGHEPDAADPKPRNVVEPMRQSVDVADAIAGAVHERLHVDAVDDGVLVPEVEHHPSPLLRNDPFDDRCTRRMRAPCRPHGVEASQGPRVVGAAAPMSVRGAGHEW